MLRQIYRAGRAALLHHVIPQSRKAIFPDGRDGVEVVGFFESASGIAESARLCARQLQDNGISVLCTGVEHYFRKKPVLPWDFKNSATKDQIGCRIIHLNPPMIPPYAFLGGLGNFSSIYNIGYWAWELEQVPAEWANATRYMNAIMTPSDFSSNAIRSVTTKPVITVPHPVTGGKCTPGMRVRLGLDDTHFVVSMIFSYESSIERKNPDAAIKAFKQAFAGIANARLVLKSGKGGDPHIRADVMRMIGSDERIVLVEEMWSKEDINALIAESDVYLSLHRSEGFGLTLAEAMLLGTPVVATDWSGNTDFCLPDNSYPVRYKLVPVQSSHAAFDKLDTSFWAEADADHAASILKGIYDHPETARQKAALCLSDTNRYFKEPRYVRALQELRR